MANKNMRILKNTDTDRYTVVNEDKRMFDSINYEGAMTLIRLFDIKVERFNAEESKIERRRIRKLL